MGKTDLTIDSVEVFRFDLAMKRPFRIATMEVHHAPNVVVAVHTRGGLTGWGEASPLHSIVGESQAIVLTAMEEFAKLVVGSEASDIAGCCRAMLRALPNNTTAASAIDMALHDVASQAAGVPLVQFLGGAPRALVTDMTVSLGEPIEMARSAEGLVAEGIRTIKLKLGSDPASDTVRVQTVRDAVGPRVRLRLDANQGWDRASAIRVLRSVESLDIEFCEQPVRATDLIGMAEVACNTSVPIMADESLFSPEDAHRILAHPSIRFGNIKLSKSRGIYFGRRIASILEAGGVPFMVGCMVESRLGLTAAAHFACSEPMARFVDLDSFHGQRDDPINGGIEVRGDVLSLPSCPGLGAAPDPAALVRVAEIRM